MDSETQNKRIELEEIAHLHTAPNKVFAYVREAERTTYQIQNRIWPHQGHAIITWLGTPIAENVSIHDRTTGGMFGYNSYKYHVTCTIFGVKYNGWYYASSGNYCRLYKLKGRK